MAILLFRTLLVYVLIIGAMRLMGKKQLGELQPSELVSTILISNLASISIESPELRSSEAWFRVHHCRNGNTPVRAVCAVPTRCKAGLRQPARHHPERRDRPSHFVRSALYRGRPAEALRGKDVFELSDVAFAIVETNGSVSVLKKFPRDTPCNKDLHIEPPTAKQPSLPLLVDGRAESRQYAALLCGCGLDRRSVPQCGARTEGRAFIFVQRRKRRRVS